MNQLISVLMPCYNAEAYVESALRSIMNQSYTNIEILAINDCSQDSTLEILKRLSSEDSRIRIVDNDTNLKLIKTLNKGVELCNGEFIARMDSDDLALPNRLEQQLAFLLQNPSVDIVGTQFKTFTNKHPDKLSLHTNPLHDEELRAYMLFKSGICHPSAMIRKRVFTDLGLFFEHQYLHVEDYAFWSKALYKTRIANLGECLLLYRVHDRQISSLNDSIQQDNKKKIYAIHMERLGIEVNDDNLSFHASIAECVPEILKSTEYLKMCENYMLNLVEINKIKQFCDTNYLLALLSIHWLRLCANSALGLKGIKTVKSSKFYNKKFYQNKDILFLYVKSLFVIKYKKSIIYSVIFR